jgi:hypothetical protein
MFVPDSPQGDYVAGLAQKSDLELTVNRLPVSTADHLDVKVSLLVDASGSVTDCQVRPEPVIPANFAGIACVQARLLKFGGISLGSNSLPAFVIEQTVSFVTISSSESTSP